MSVHRCEAKAAWLYKLYLLWGMYLEKFHKDQIILNDNLQRESDTVRPTCLSHGMAVTMYQSPSVHLGPSTCRCYTDKLVSRK